MAEPMATGTLTRRQAPEGEASSSLAEEVWRVPNWSSQETSTTAIMAVRGSVLIVLILSLCIGRNWKWFRGGSVFCWVASISRCDAVFTPSWRYCRIEKRTGPSVLRISKSACAHWEGYGFRGTGVGRKITGAGMDGPSEDSHENLYTSGSDSEREAAHTQRMRRVLEDGRHLGASAIVPGVRVCGLLRLVEE
jgi:hypothetical protein